MVDVTSSDSAKGATQSATYSAGGASSKEDRSTRFPTYDITAPMHPASRSHAITGSAQGAARTRTSSSAIEGQGGGSPPSCAKAEKEGAERASDREKIAAAAAPRRASRSATGMERDACVFSLNGFRVQRAKSARRLRRSTRAEKWRPDVSAKKTYSTTPTSIFGRAFPSLGASRRRARDFFFCRATKSRLDPQHLRRFCFSSPSEPDLPEHVVPRVLEHRFKPPRTRAHLRRRERGAQRGHRPGVPRLFTRKRD
mmetsp:Transcript_11941/g.51241  ORF Transcript_11941/g.51241 Transcript_11941/m.51241 type:complete len:255 (+) Transcript_11941:371-1135(+)